MITHTYTHIHFYNYKLKDTLSRHLFNQKHLLSTYSVLATVFHIKGRNESKDIVIALKEFTVNS